MSKQQSILKNYEIETAMISCLSCNYEIKITYDNPELHINDLAGYLKHRKDICHHYFDIGTSDETKESLRQMFLQLNIKMARYLNIVTDEHK